MLRLFFKDKRAQGTINIEKFVSTVRDYPHCERQEVTIPMLAFVTTMVRTSLPQSDNC